jgi:hypothetical protein
VPVGVREHAPDLRACRLRVPESVVFQVLPAETVVLSLSTGRYHGLNPSAGMMLELLVASHGGVQDAAARLAHQSGRPLAAIEADLCKLCDDLLGRGLLEIADAGQP